jgi:hypothetical protein
MPSGNCLKAFLLSGRIEATPILSIKPEAGLAPYEFLISLLLFQRSNRHLTAADWEYSSNKPYLKMRYAERDQPLNSPSLILTKGMK